MHLDLQTAPTVIMEPALEQRLTVQLTNYANLCEERDALDDTLGEVKDSIEGLREQAGADSLKIEQWTVTRVPGATRRTLNVDKLKKVLLAQGVPLDLIDQCYEDKTAAAYTKISQSKA